jgi:hypothetical protein
MAAKPTNSSGVVSVRARTAFVTPPAILGAFAALLEPDSKFGDPKFQARFCFNDVAREALVARIGEHVLEPLWPKFLKEIEGAAVKEPKGGWVKPDPEAWVDDHLKDPYEKASIQVPSITFGRAADVRDRKTGDLKRIEMRAWDRAGTPLDIKALKLSTGSTVQAVLTPSIWISPIQKSPAFSFKLDGLRVIKLVQYLGSAGPGAMDDEDMSLLGDDFGDADDLAGYAAGPPQSRTTGSEMADLGDPLPF